MPIKDIINGITDKAIRTSLSIKFGFIVPTMDDMMNYSKCRLLFYIVRNYTGEKTLSWK